MTVPKAVMAEEYEPLEADIALYSVGFLQQFSDSLIKRFINLLAIAVGASVGQLGFLNAARVLSINLFQLVFGRLADQMGKRRFIAVGRIVNGLLLFTILFTDSPSWFVSLVIGAAIFTSMAMPSWSSLIGDYTTEDRRGEIVGKVYSVSFIGGLVAMISAFLLSINQNAAITRNSYTPIIFIAAVASILSGLTTFFLRELPLKKTRESMRIEQILGDGPLKRFLFLTFLYGVGSSVAMPLFPYIMAEKLQLTVWQVALTSITNTLIGALSQQYVGPYLDRVGRRQVLALSRMVMASSCLVYPFASSWIHIAAVEAISGFGIASWMSSQSTYIIDIAPRSLRATYLASSMAAIGVATFLGSNLGGQIVQTYLGGGLPAIQTGLIVAGILRLVLGSFFFTIKETRT